MKEIILAISKKDQSAICMELHGRKKTSNSVNKQKKRIIYSMTFFTIKNFAQLDPAP